MKRHTLAIVIGAGLAMMGGIASAASDDIMQHSLQGIRVQPYHAFPYATAERPLGECTPPSYLKICEGVNQQLREAFNIRELGMLFNAATPYPEFLTSYLRVTTRYHDFLRRYETNDNAPVAVASQ